VSVNVTHLTSLGTLDCLPIYHTLLIQAGDDVGALLRGDGSDERSRVLISMLRLSLAVPPKALELLCSVFAGWHMSCCVQCAFGGHACVLFCCCAVLVLQLVYSMCLPTSVYLSFRCLPTPVGIRGGYQPS
jgi:hypothetical protein